MKKMMLLAVAVLMAVTASAQEKGPRTGFRWGFGTGYVVGTEHAGMYDNWTFDFTCGAQIRPWFYVGGGIGVDVFTQSNKWKNDLTPVQKALADEYFPNFTPVNLPIFAQVKFFIPTRSIAQPYFDIRLGYSIEMSKHEKKSYVVPSTEEVITIENGWADALIGEIGAGVELADHWNISVGYHFNNFYRVENVRRATTFHNLATSNGFVARIGYRF